MATASTDAVRQSAAPMRSSVPNGSVGETAPMNRLVAGTTPQFDERLALSTAALRVGQVDADVDALARREVECPDRARAAP